MNKRLISIGTALLLVLSSTQVVLADDETLSPENSTETTTTGTFYGSAQNSTQTTTNTFYGSAQNSTQTTTNTFYGSAQNSTEVSIPSTDVVEYKFYNSASNTTVTPAAVFNVHVNYTDENGNTYNYYVPISILDSRSDSVSDDFKAAERNHKSVMYVQDIAGSINDIKPAESVKNIVAAYEINLTEAARDALERTNAEYTITLSNDKVFVNGTKYRVHHYTGNTENDTEVSEDSKEYTAENNALKITLHGASPIIIEQVTNLPETNNNQASVSKSSGTKNSSNVGNRYQSHNCGVK